MDSKKIRVIIAIVSLIILPTWEPIHPWLDMVASICPIDNQSSSAFQHYYLSVMAMISALFYTYYLAESLWLTIFLSFISIPLISIIIMYFGYFVIGQMAQNINLINQTLACNLFIIAIFIHSITIPISTSSSKGGKNDDDYEVPEGGPELMAFSSHNNIFTAGNNAISFRVRNMEDYPIVFRIALKVGDKWKEQPETYELGAKEMKTFSTLGPAWRKAKDIKISYWR